MKQENLQLIPKKYKGYKRLPCTNTLENPEEMSKLLETRNLPKVNTEEVENLNGLINQ